MNKNGFSITEPEEKEKEEQESITMFRLNDEFHKFNNDDEVIEFIGERIRALENLGQCTKLKVSQYEFLYKSTDRNCFFAAT